MTLTGEQQAVAETNDAFYDALTQRDLTAMDRLWFPAEWVECVHPGMAQMSGVFVLTVSTGLLVFGGLFGAWILLLFIGVKLFRREAILTRWK